MSNALAIATVTATLKDFLDTIVAKPDPNPAGPFTSEVSVKHLSPDDKTLRGATDAMVNIFLYQVVPSPAWRNADLPTRRADGSPLRRPQVGLDLHYLITFYGNTTQLEPQRMLGAVVRALHAQPVLSRDAIATTIKQTSFLNGKVSSNLADQIELVRFTPINFSLEEMSKLWSVFLKTDYALSVAYAASVVLIETDDPEPATALPVLKPCIQAIPFSLAAIDSVEPQSVLLSAPPATTQITLRGRGLASDFTPIFTTPGKTNSIPGAIAPGGTSSAITVTLPPGLRPGLNTVQLIRATSSSPPGSPAITAQSNAAPFLLLPFALNLAIASPPEHVIVTVRPTVDPAQDVSLVLNEFGVTAPARPQSFVLPADPHATETDTFSFQVGSIPHGDYLARIRVDAAESQLNAGPNGFDQPRITI
jgi:hypothetical protein